MVEGNLAMVLVDALSAESVMKVVFVLRRPRLGQIRNEAARRGELTSSQPKVCLPG